MRKLLLVATLLFFGVLAAHAQAPAFFNYQGVARNSVGNALVNKTITLRLSIHDGGALGPVTYRETRSVTTNAFGLFSVQVGGAGATNVSGSIAGTNWNTGTKWLQVEIDPEGGGTLKDVGTTQLTSVPYSLYTSQSGDVVLPFVKMQNEESPLMKITNTGNNANSLAYEGTSNSTATNATALRGIIASASPGGFSAGVTGQNNGTSGNGIGVMGTQNGTGWGVYGATPGGVGVYGNSTSGTGVYGQSVSGASIIGFQPATGTANSGLFQNTNTNNSAAVLRVLTNGIGEGFGVNVSGTGRTAVLQNTNAANNSTVLDVSTNGTGRTAFLQNTNAANNANVLDVTTNGAGRAGQFQNTNTTNTAPTLSVFTNGAGEGVQSIVSGSGKAGSFNTITGTNASNTLEAVTVGLGRSGYFQNGNAANNATTVEVTSNGIGKTGVINSTNPANAATAFEVVTNGLNRAGLFQNINNANTAILVEATTNGAGKVAQFQNTNAANTGTVITALTNGTGRVAQLQNTNAANGSVVIDAATNGTGKVAQLQNTNGSNASNVLEVTTNGTGRVAQLQNTNAANGSVVIDAATNGTGKVAQLQNTNATNASNILDVSTNGTGKVAQLQNTNNANGSNVLDVTTNGTGKVVQLQNTNAANASSALDVTTNGTGAAASFTSSNTSNASTALQANQAGTGRGAFINATNTANSANAFEVAQAGMGRIAFFNATNAGSSANALEVTTVGTGFAANFVNTNVSPKALRTVGAIQLTGIGEGANKILMTDLSGNANWNSLASVGGVSGTGTLNYLTKWTPNGTFVGNSIVFDDGTNVGVGLNNPTSRLTVSGDFYAKTSTSGYVGVFENTNASDGDGIKIKLGKAKSVYSPPALPGSLSPSQTAAMRSLLSCDVNVSQKLSTLGDIIVSTVTEDAQAIAGMAVGVGNMILGQLNTLMGLPINFPEIKTPAVNFPALNTPDIVVDVPVIPTFTIPGIHITDGFNILPETVILPSFEIFPKFPTIDLSGIGIPSIDISSLSFWGIPTGLCLSDAPGSTPLNNTNEFIRFTDKNDAKMGSIRAVSVSDWASNYLNPAFMYTLYSAFTSSKLDKYHAKYHFTSELSKALQDYGKLGVEYASGNGDYAEWLERTDVNELITAGDIVGVKGGKITKDLECAEQVMAVSHNPIVLGNVPKEGKTNAGNNIAFMGQIPVKVMGPVASGDYIVGQSSTPGYGTARHPEAMSIEDFKLAVGRSWVSDPNPGPKMVNTVVGVHNGDYLRILKNFESKFNASETRLQTLESKVDALLEKSSSTKKGF